MTNDIYGGRSFPFHTPLSFPEMKWLGRAIIGAIVALVVALLGGLAAIAYLFF